MSLQAFIPSPNVGATVLSSTAGSATLYQPSSGGMQDVELTNPSTVDCYYTVGKSSGITATLPTSAVPGSNVILQRTSKQFGVPPNFFISTITSAGEADLVIQPGMRQ